mgnify:CR=1 FL=1
MSASLAGTFLVFMFCIITALSTIAVTEIELTYGPLMVTFFSITITILWFNAFQLKNTKRIRLLCVQHRIALIWLNISTAIMWITTFFALQSLPPDVFTAILFGGIPVCIFILTCKNTQSSRVKKIELLFTLIIASLLFLIGYHTLSASHFSTTAISGIALTFVTAFSGAWTIILSHRFAQTGYSATEILSQRFYGLWLFSGGLLFFFPTSAALIVGFLPFSVVIAALSFIIPLFLLQKGIERVDPMMVSFLSPLIPIFAFFMEMFAGRFSFDGLELILLVLLAITVITAAVAKLRYQPQKIDPPKQ